MSGTDGSSPRGGLTLGKDGNFYGDAVSGGSSNDGTLFKVTPAGTLTLLHTFINSGDFYNPFNADISGTDGNFYGTTNSNSASIFKVTPAGVFKTIHTLSAAEGFQGGQLALGSDGSFYGAMNLNGANGQGTAYKVTAAGAFTVLHNFTGADGADAAEGMVQASNGKFYGAASLGGTSNAGVVYSLTSAKVYTVLHNLNGTSDGFEPFGTMILASDGNLYGVTNSGGSSNCGTIFKVTLAGAYSVVFNFDNTHGCNPREQVIQSTNGLLYGLVNGGGAHGAGVFYSLNVSAAPFVNLDPSQRAGNIGASVGILGQGFSGASVVKFGAVTAAFTLTGTTYITATVPVGAHSGPVTVTTGATTLTSNATFKVTPTITTFSPTMGPVGTSVVIHGTGLLQATTVKFGKVVASGFTVNSDSQVTVLVPAGSSPGAVNIVITTPGGTATSGKKFTVQ